MIRHRYQSEPSNLGDILRPIADVIIEYKNERIEVSMYIDSGADITMVPFRLGNALGFKKWFGHKEERWEEFKKRYKDELNNKKDLIKKITALKSATLLYAAKDVKRNNAVALLEFLKNIN